MHNADPLMRGSLRCASIAFALSVLSLLTIATLPPLQYCDTPILVVIPWLWHETTDVLDYCDIATTRILAMCLQSCGGGVDWRYPCRHKLFGRGRPLWVWSRRLQDYVMRQGVGLRVLGEGSCHEKSVGLRVW